MGVGAAARAATSVTGAGRPVATTVSKPVAAVRQTPAKVRAVLLDRLKAADAGAGARTRLRKLPVRDISLNAVAAAVLGQNLDIRSAGESIESAKALVVQSDAIFDPTIFTSVTYTNRFTKERQDEIGRFRDTQVTLESEEEQAERLQKEQETGESTSPGLVFCSPAITLDGQELQNTSTVSSCQQPPTYSILTEEAVTENLGAHTITGSLGASLRFAIGGSTSVQVSSTYRKANFFSTSGNPALTTATFPSGATYDPYGWGDDKLLWSSQAVASVQMPLPFTKGFGLDGSADYFNFRLAQQNQERSVWVERSTRNGTLAQALTAFWDLVGTRESLVNLLELRRVLSERQARQQALFRQELITQYDISQIDVELANLDAREETTWNQYLILSNRLATLMAEGGAALIMPAEGESLLAGPLTVEADGAYERAVEGHPDLKAEEQRYDGSRLSLTFRENQDLPDISLTASASVGQTDSAFGYPSALQSLRNLVRPDNSNLFVGLRYRVPFGHNQTEAALARAKLDERQSFDRLRQVRQQVVTGVERAINDAQSAAAQVRQSDADLTIAETAYGATAEQRDLGLVSEFEVLNRYSDLLNARLGRIATRVAFRKAEIRLWAAQGILEQKFVR